MVDVTRILERIENGQVQATRDLFPVVYAELKRIAARKMSVQCVDHTLSATALVHEAYVRLVDADTVRQWKSRVHFFAAAAEAMRRILIDNARRKRSEKRGGGRKRLEGHDFAANVAIDPDLLLDVDAGLEQLAQDDPQIAEFFKLRIYAGLSVTEAGKLLGMSRSTAYRNWEFVCSWFTVHHPDWVA
jgi:RNA polymerase sigma factor (TIGR02999 family)